MPEFLLGLVCGICFGAVVLVVVVVVIWWQIGSAIVR